MSNNKTTIKKYEFNKLEEAIFVSIITLCRYSACSGYTMPKTGIVFLMKHFSNDKELIARLIEGCTEIFCGELDVLDEDVTINDMPCSIAHFAQVNEEEYYKDYKEDCIDKAIKSLIRAYKEELEYN
jgi:hypothetical protein